MSNILVLAAGNWKRVSISATFAVKTNNVQIRAMPRYPQFFEIPTGTFSLEITAEPIKPAMYWGRTVSLAVAPNGTISATPAVSPFVGILAVNAPLQEFTLINCKLSRFREVSAEFRNLLVNPPTSRTIPKQKGRPASTVQDDELAALRLQYGSWPPASWSVPRLTTASFLDTSAPVDGNALPFPAPTPVDPKVDIAILELKGANSPQIYGVTWPQAIAPKPNATAPSYLLYLRQTSAQNATEDGMFEGTAFKPDEAYPRNFDYAERCLYESMHYGQTPLMRPVPGGKLAFALRPKGVPYQIAKAGVNVVTVYPVARVDFEYSDLNVTDRIEGILEEVQAFMFWSAGVPDPPAKIGKTAISAFSSSTNHVLQYWLTTANINGNFLKNVVTALYIFDAPNPGKLMPLALAWASVAGSKKRIRLYGRGVEKPNPEVSKFHNNMIGWTGPGNPAVPFIKTTPDNKHTIALLPASAWQVAFRNRGMTEGVGEWDAHHLIPAAMLTHAISMGDLT